MKVQSIDLGIRSFLAAPIFAVGWIGFVAPGVATTIFHDSTIALEISNFSHPAIEVHTKADTRAVAIAGDSGKVEIKASLNSLFYTDESTVGGFSFSKSTVSAEGLSNLARKNLASTLIGRFSIQANTDFRFDITAHEFLWNFTSDSTSRPVTALGMTSLFLQDISRQKTINVFDFTGSINTGNAEKNNLDLLKFHKNPGMNVLEYTSQTFSDGEEEFIDFFLTASFQISVSQDTELVLFATTRSCFDTSSEGGICTVPEPSTAGGLLVGAIGLGGFGLLRKVMNRVIKLIF